MVRRPVARSGKATPNLVSLHVGPVSLRSSECRHVLCRGRMRCRLPRCMEPLWRRAVILDLISFARPAQCAGVPRVPVLCLKASFGGWVNFIDYRFRALSRIHSLPTPIPTGTVFGDTGRDSGSALTGGSAYSQDVRLTPRPSAIWMAPIAGSISPGSNPGPAASNRIASARAFTQ